MKPSSAETWEQTVRRAESVLLYAERILEPNTHRLRIGDTSEYRGYMHDVKSAIESRQLARLIAAVDRLKRSIDRDFDTRRRPGHVPCHPSIREITPVLPTEHNWSMTCIRAQASMMHAIRELELHQDLFTEADAKDLIGYVADVQIAINLKDLALLLQVTEILDWVIYQVFGGRGDFDADDSGGAIGTRRRVPRRNGGGKGLEDGPGANFDVS